MPYAPDPARGHRRLVVMPARDEVATVEAMARRAAAASGCPVLVVSDASSDGTEAAARRGGAMVLELPIQLGAWGATQAGIRFALRHGYDTVVTLDADGQHDPACIARLLDAFEAGQADVVIGTCPERLSRAKKLAWGWFRALTGLGVEDLTSGFRVYGVRALHRLASPEATLLDYQDVGVLLLLRKYRLQVSEVPTPMMARCAGHSRVFASWFVVAGYMVKTTILCLARIGRLRPGREAAEALPEASA